MQNNPLYFEDFPTGSLQHVPGMGRGPGQQTGADPGA